MNSTKEKQLQIILENNPVEDDIHTWVRSVDDIKTFEEAVEEEPLEKGECYAPDFTKEMADEALADGVITVYSSKPIDKGNFVTPSKMEAESYSGTGQVFSKQVSLEDIAWIDSLQGQYAPVSQEREKKKAKQEYER